MLRVTHLRGPRINAVDECVFTPVYIGTAEGSDVAFPPGADPNIGPHHAEIHFNQGALYVIDRGTPTGTYVRGVRVGQQLLAKGDPISFGHPAGTCVQVELVAPLVPRPHGVQTDVEGRVDLATAQQLVANAVRHATAQPDDTAALVAGKVHKATRRSSRVLTLLSVGVVLSLLATVVGFVYVYRSQKATQVLASEVGLGETEEDPEGEIPEEVLSGRDIYQGNKYALYVIGYIDGKRVGGCCTAFAISSKMLATNAHCVTSCVENNDHPVVIQNEGGGRVRFDIVETEIHPRYRDDDKRSNTPDVALLKVRGKMPKKVTLASEAELLAIGPGDDAYVLGFPGRVMDPSNPVATFLKGNVGRTTNLDGESVSARRASLIQHNAVTRGGNSGSPIFNQYGHVIAIHTAHIDDEDVVRIGGKKTKVVESSPFRLGMRIDLLKKVPAP